MKNKNIKKIAIICGLDGFANSIRPFEIQKQLEKQGHDVCLINTFYECSLSQNKKSILSKLPSYKPLNLALYLVESIIFLQNKFFRLTKATSYYYLLILQMRLRAIILLNTLIKGKFDFIICETQHDSYVFLHDIPGIKIYNCTVPWSDELYMGGDLSEDNYNKLKELEIKIYTKSDYLFFPWHLYTEYIQKNIYKGKNLSTLTWGCTQRSIVKKVKYNNTPKIVYLGLLDGNWVNVKLLSKLTKLYKNIDVYGGPPPDVKLGLNYKGYALKTDVLKDYQFGLITISKDKLRKSSFSSKHLEYLSYGLPVLTPDWRKDSKLDDVSIYYNEANFLKQLKKYSQKDNWEEMSRKSYQKAQNFNWEKGLRKLNSVINDSQN